MTLKIGDREHGRRGEQRRPAQLTQEVPGVLPDMLEGKEALLFPVGVGDGAYRSQLETSLTLRLGWRRARTPVGSRLQRDMLRDFFPQPRIVLPHTCRRAKPLEKAAQGPHLRSPAFACTKRLMSAAVRSQSWVSARSCLRPAAVRR
jgi:hypothetical protein